MEKFDYFISYSSKDSKIAFDIVDEIEKTGHSCWIAPRNIMYGTPYARAIMKGIDNCQTVIVLITENSNKSEDVLNEVDNAHTSRKKLIPIRLNNTSLSQELNYYLSRTQQININDDDYSKIPVLLGLQLTPIPNVSNTLREKRKSRNILREKRKSHNILREKWKSRNTIINIVLIAVSLLLIWGLIFPFLHHCFIPLYYISVLFGGTGVTLLLYNREDGFANIFVAGLFWELANAYEETSLRFFQESSFLVNYLPILICCALPFLLLLPYRGKAWWKACKKISTIGIIISTITGILWVGVIYFDTTTKLGLPHNLRYYIQSLL